MYRSHSNFFVSWFRTMINGFIFLFQGLIILLSLGYFSPHWDINYVFHCSIKDMKRRINNV